MCVVVSPRSYALRSPPRVRQQLQFTVHSEIPVTPVLTGSDPSLYHLMIIIILCHSQNENLRFLLSLLYLEFTMRFTLFN